MPLMPKSHEEQIGLRSKATYDTDKRDSDGFYQSARWRAIRSEILSSEPLCRICGVEAATDVDHKLQRKERPDLAYDAANLQPLCHSCHAIKSGQERKQYGNGKEVRLYRGMGR